MNRIKLIVKCNEDWLSKETEFNFGNLNFSAWDDENLLPLDKGKKLGDIKLHKKFLKRLYK